MSATLSQSVGDIDHFGILRETRRIVRSHSRHFLSLSVLFLLPLSFSLCIYPTLHSTLLQNDVVTPQTLLRSTPHLHPSITLILLPFLYTLFLTFLSISATATITYSTFHGFYGRPVRFTSSLKSLLYSFLPLFTTLVVSQSILALICTVFGIFGVLVYNGILIFGFEIDYDSGFFHGFCLFLWIVLGLVLIWVQVNWALVNVIVVLESKWGIEPLRRSAYLVKGMRGVSFKILLLFGFTIGFLFWGYSIPMVSFNGWRRSLEFVFKTVFGSSVVTMLMSQNLAANTVFYMYCKALKGELTFEIAEDFAREYYSLPVDEEKLPPFVHVA